MTANANPAILVNFPKDRSIHRVRVRPLPGCVKWVTSKCRMKNEMQKKYVRLYEIYYSHYLQVNGFFSICTLSAFSAFFCIFWDYSPIHPHQLLSGFCSVTF